MTYRYQPYGDHHSAVMTPDNKLLCVTPYVGHARILVDHLNDQLRMIISQDWLVDQFKSMILQHQPPQPLP